MQSKEMSFQSAFERGQHLCCSDVYRKVIPPSWGQNREQSIQNYIFLGGLGVDCIYRFSNSNALVW